MRVATLIYVLSHALTPIYGGKIGKRENQNENRTLWSNRKFGPTNSARVDQPRPRSHGGSSQHLKGALGGEGGKKRTEQGRYDCVGHRWGRRRCKRLCSSPKQHPCTPRSDPASNCSHQKSG